MLKLLHKRKRKKGQRMSQMGRTTRKKGRVNEGTQPARQHRRLMKQRTAAFNTDAALSEPLASAVAASPEADCSAAGILSSIVPE